MINIVFFGQYQLIYNLVKESSPDRGSNYTKDFNELYIVGFDFSNGLKLSDINIFEKMNTFSNKRFWAEFSSRGKKMET